MRVPLTARSWRSLLAPAVIGASMVVAAGCGDDDDDETKTLSLVSGTKGANVSTADLDPQGRSPGDVYVFDNPLLDADEQETLGRVYGTQTSVALTKDTEIVQAMITYDLGDGDRITIGGISEYPLGETGLKESRQFERPIIGGTGEYEGASGTVSSVRRSDGSYEQTFEIED